LKELPEEAQDMTPASVTKYSSKRGLEYSIYFKRNQGKLEQKIDLGE